MKLLKNYLYNVGYQVFVLLIPLITVPYVSRVLGSEGVGINAFTNSIIQYFILFGSIGINLYGNRTIAYYRDNREKSSQVFWEILFLRIIFIMISYIGFLFFLVSVEQYTDYYMYQSIFILAAGLDISWYFMGIEDFKKTVMRNVIIKILSLLAIFIFVKNPEDLGVYILVLSVSTLLGNVLLWTYLKKMIYRPIWKELSVFKHLIPTLTLFIPQVATQIYLVLNKTMLGVMTTTENVAYFEQSDKIVKIVLAIVTAVGTVMLPRIANLHARGSVEKVKEYMYISFDFVTSICFPMAFGLAAIAPKFSVWFLGNEFGTTATLLPILSLVIIWIGWSNVLGTQYLLPTNQTRFYTLSVLIGAMVNLLANIILIPKYGVVGAIYSTVISEMCVSLVQFYVVKRNLKLMMLFNGTWKYFVAASVMFFAIRHLNTIMRSSFVMFSIQIFLGTLVYLLIVILLKPPVLTNVNKILNKNNTKI